MIYTAMSYKQSLYWGWHENCYLVKLLGGAYWGGSSSREDEQIQWVIKSDQNGGWSNGGFSPELGGRG